ncbi:17660_t:CDS:2, partial [Dentiscutata erythropus]
IIQSYSNEITNESVKTILKRHGYFEDTQVLAETLKPIRAAIQITESKDTTMANCYINLIKIASAIKDLSSEDYQDFRNHCIKVFNEREDEIRSWINRAYDQMIEDDSEDIDIDSPLLPEPISESNERTDIELELERIISIEKVFVIINNSNENLEEDNSSIDGSNINNEGEDYDPALFAADYLSE